MMTAVLAAKNINGENFNLWQVNTDAEYHEEGSGDDQNSGRMVPRRAAA
jgi:hypothetical protein